MPSVLTPLPFSKTFAHPIVPLLEHLERLLEEGDMEASTLAHSETSLLRTTLGDYCPPLLATIGSFDYEQALKHLRAARAACLAEPENPD